MLNGIPYTRIYGCHNDHNTLYIGLDVHKETIEVVALGENETNPYIEKMIPNRMKSIKRVFWNLLSEGTVIACYEAGCNEFILQCVLEWIRYRLLLGSLGIYRGKAQNISIKTSET
jgi:hypothetical protein